MISICTSYESEAALNCKERFEKNRPKLFTFLNHDGVPWNNNNVEHAIKAFARLRRTIEGLSTPKGIKEYVIRMNVWQTCKYMGVGFLEFPPVCGKGHLHICKNAGAGEGGDSIAPTSLTRKPQPPIFLRRVRKVTERGFTFLQKGISIPFRNQLNRRCGVCLSVQAARWLANF